MPEAPLFSERDGHQLAADMLRELEAGFLAQADSVPADEPIDTAWQRSDSKVLRSYLATVATAKSPELEQGFFAVLTEALGATMNGYSWRPGKFDGATASERS